MTSRDQIEIAFSVINIEFDVARVALTGKATTLLFITGQKWRFCSSCIITFTFFFTDNHFFFSLSLSFNHHPYLHELQRAQISLLLST
ncbi:hypothetical protein L6452_26929 [Arctium lappa]|uniref:Uncharacterized protein n=1 Tax=Arctium lappa TaxID=4217 RepID=A0ACB8ZVW3_ARCLA|nr:hypothetical protein L6452_26929 [Arctium lappa]